MRCGGWIVGLRVFEKGDPEVVDNMMVDNDLIELR
jgi:hypothetical protein